MGYLRESLKGISWMTALTGLTKAAAIFKIAVLARILTPTQFGNYGIALLVLGFLEVLTETGINIFLIQQKEDTEEYLDSAWVVSILRGLLIALLIIAASPVIIIFFNTPEARNLLYLIAGVAAVRGFINPMIVAFQKKLEFMKVFMFQGGLYLVDACVAIGLGVLTKNESAMIIGMLAAAVLEVILSFVLFKARPRLRFEKDKFTKVLNAGKWVTGAGVFSYLFQNLDNIVVGRVLGTTSLGFYQQSYSIATLPVMGVSGIFNKVMFPVFVKISENARDLKASFYKAMVVIFTLSSVFGIVVLLFSRPIILLFLGENWLTIEPTLKVLAVFGVLKSVLNSTYSLFLSLKMQKSVMLSEFLGILGIGAAIYPMVTMFGTVGAAYSTIVAVMVSAPVVLINLKNIFNQKNASDD